MVGHPRSFSDILLRSVAIHAFATAAYANLLWLLPSLTGDNAGHAVYQSLGLSGHRSKPLLRLVPYISLFALFPAFLPAHLALRLVLPVILREDTLVNALSLSHPSTFTNAAPSSCVAVLTAIVLSTAFAGYRTRLSMNFHGATYVGNLGLDHRNGWTAVSGLVACGLSVAVLFLRTGLFRSSREPSPGDQGQCYGQGDGKQAQDAEGRAWRTTWRPLAEAGIAALLQQQPQLGKPPHSLRGLSINAMPMPFLGAGLGCLIYWRLGWRDPPLPKMAVGIFVILTALLQAGWDIQELWNVLHGRVEEYNYRWAVRDDFSVRLTGPGGPPM